MHLVKYMRVTDEPWKHFILVVCALDCVLNCLSFFSLVCLVKYRIIQKLTRHISHHREVDATWD